MSVDKHSSAQQVLRRWKMHRNALLSLAEKFPESSASWRPWDKGMSTLELIHHIAWTPDFFFAAIEGRDVNIPPLPATLAEMRKLLQDLTKEHEEKIAGYSDDDLKKEATIHALRITEPIVEILHRMIGHEVHHKGQLITYARILNIEPPFYVDLSV
ncbi:MAG: DinB family protein [Alicyclobacillaceae bacterium]|nr:DinB family protein [Alicyclobacillaceae bacterium]